MRNLLLLLSILFLSSCSLSASEFGGIDFWKKYDITHLKDIHSKFVFSENKNFEMAGKDHKLNVRYNSVGQPMLLELWTEFEDSRSLLYFIRKMELDNDIRFEELVKDTGTQTFNKIKMTINTEWSMYLMILIW